MGGLGTAGSLSLTGTLKACPVDTGVYEWAITEVLFRARKLHETIGRSMTASMEHHRHEDGHL